MELDGGLECVHCGQLRPLRDHFTKRLRCGHLPRACAPCLQSAAHCPRAGCGAELDEAERAAVASKVKDLDASAFFLDGIPAEPQQQAAPELAAAAAPVPAAAAGRSFLFGFPSSSGGGDVVAGPSSGGSIASGSEYVFRVRSMDGSEKQIRLPLGATGLDLKNSVQTAFGVPVQQQRIFVADPEGGDDVEIRALIDGLPVRLSAMSVRSGDTLMLMRVYNLHAGETDVARAPRDRFGNAAGSEFDLGADRAFRGLTIAVLHEYTGGEAAPMGHRFQKRRFLRPGDVVPAQDGAPFDFSLPAAALRAKGFKVHRWPGPAPPLHEFSRVLDEACQLWIISGSDENGLERAHIDRIQRFFNSGRGLFIWGDNKPFIRNANRITQRLFSCNMTGSEEGGDVVRRAPDYAATQGCLPGPAGFVPHAITTGLTELFEGHTVSTIQQNRRLRTLVRGSSGQVVSAYIEEQGRRAVLDGGFTRLYNEWDTAGTARYVVNAAAWLANFENRLY
eukprot:tig00000093_g3502.t1